MHLIFGAIGYATDLPPALVAIEMKASIEEKKFGGWFGEIVFVIDSEPQLYSTWHQRAGAGLGQLARSTG
jgi:hypothetical protein